MLPRFRRAIAAAAPPAARRLKKVPTMNCCKPPPTCSLRRPVQTDAYWHGHFWRNLRPASPATDPWRNLISRRSHRRPPDAPAPLAPRASNSLDYDADGAQRVCSFTAPEAQALLKPNDGGTIRRARFPPPRARHGSSIPSCARPRGLSHTPFARRPAAKSPPPAPVAKHPRTDSRERTRSSKKYLRYDSPGPATAFRVLIFDPRAHTHGRLRSPRIARRRWICRAATYAVKKFPRRTKPSFSSAPIPLVPQGKSASAAAPNLLLLKQYTFSPRPQRFRSRPAKSL